VAGVEALELGPPIPTASGLPTANQMALRSPVAVSSAGRCAPKQFVGVPLSAISSVEGDHGHRPAHEVQRTVDRPCTVSAVSCGAAH
jgi:hypothetical protein